MNLPIHYDVAYGHLLTNELCTKHQGLKTLVVTDPTIKKKLRRIIF